MIQQTNEQSSTDSFWKTKWLPKNKLSFYTTIFHKSWRGHVKSNLGSISQPLYSFERTVFRVHLVQSIKRKIRKLLFDVILFSDHWDHRIKNCFFFCARLNYLCQIPIHTLLIVDAQKLKIILNEASQKQRISTTQL